MSLEQDGAAARAAVDLPGGARYRTTHEPFATAYGDGDDDGIGGSGRTRR